MESTQLQPELVSGPILTLPDHKEAVGYLLLDDDLTKSDIVIPNT